MAAEPSTPGWADPSAVARVVITVVAVIGMLALIYVLRQPLGWLFLATFLAIAVSGPVAWFSKFMPRGAAIAITYLLLFLVPLALLLAIVPSLVHGVQALVDAAPGYAADTEHWVRDNAWLKGLEDDYQIISKVQERLEDLPSMMGDVAGWLGNLGLGLVNSGFALVNILLLSMFIVGGGPRWSHAMISRASPRHAERLERVLAGVGAAVGNYVMGALAQALVAAITTYIVLVILGVPFAVGLAAITFLLDLIPLVGATIAGVLVGVVTVFSGFPTDTIIWTIWAVVYQQIENNLIQPQIQRRAVSIEPIVVLISVLCGATLAGILGAVLAIPVAASLQIVLREWREMVAAARDVLPGAGDEDDPAPPDADGDAPASGAADGTTPAPA
ncbi:MAG: AI-2E family transporter [Solirubrobacteraceae bacterium]|nr:AI-2E family transporter [Solirubrobacteraceae bacterium]